MANDYICLSLTRSKVNYTDFTTKSSYLPPTLHILEMCKLLVILYARIDISKQIFSYKKTKFKIVGWENIRLKVYTVSSCKVGAAINIVII